MLKYCLQSERSKLLNTITVTPVVDTTNVFKNNLFKQFGTLFFVRNCIKIMVKSINRLPLLLT